MMLLIASVLVLMLALCGCRTRITNNNEVSNVMYDEDGYLQEQYDLRRDELSLGKAKKPLFTGFGAPEEEEDFEDYSGDAELLEEYEPEEFEEEPEEEEPEPQPQRVSQGNNSGAGTTKPAQTSKVVNRKRSKNHNSADPNATVTVTLDANGGVCGADALKVKTTGTYGELPTATMEGYDFVGWFTKASGGTQITADSKVISTKKHTLYAQYKVAEEPEPQPEPEPEPEPEVKTFTVTFDLNDADEDAENKASFSSGGEPVQVEENGVYAAMPTAVRSGYLFEGWFTDPAAGDRISEGDPFTAAADQTLYVHWGKEDPYDTWTKKYDESADTVKDEEKLDFYMADNSKEEKSFIEGCKGKVIDTTETDKPIYVVKFIKDIDEAKALEADTAIRADEKYAEKQPTTVLIDEAAVKGDKNTQLAYKYIILNTLYGRPDDATLGAALAGLGIEDDLAAKVFVYTAE